MAKPAPSHFSPEQRGTERVLGPFAPPRMPQSAPPPRFELPSSEFHNRRCPLSPFPIFTIPRTPYEHSVLRKHYPWQPRHRPPFRRRPWAAPNPVTVDWIQVFSPFLATLTDAPVLVETWRFLVPVRAGIVPLCTHPLTPSRVCCVLALAGVLPTKPPPHLLSNALAMPRPPSLAHPWNLVSVVVGVRPGTDPPEPTAHTEARLLPLGDQAKAVSSLAWLNAPCSCGQSVGVRWW